MFNVIYVYIYYICHKMKRSFFQAAVTCLLSWKLFKLNKPDMQETAGEAGTNS